MSTPGARGAKRIPKRRRRGARPSGGGAGTGVKGFGGQTDDVRAVTARRPVQVREVCKRADRQSWWGFTTLHPKGGRVGA